jgi:uncharacterized protein YbjT (DUF2867 family)
LTLGNLSYRAVVIGGTGAVGGAVVRSLLASRACAGIVALTRRPFTAEGLAPKGEVRVVDYTDLERATATHAAGCVVAFCTVGVGQPRKVSDAEFRRVDIELAGAFARGAAAAGVRRIALLSAVGANAHSRNWYLRVKGLAEQAVIEAGIACTSLFRPSLLVTKEVRYGLQDRLTQTLFPLVAPLLPRRFHQITVEALGRAMRLNAEVPGPAGVEYLYYPDCMTLLRGAREGLGTL